jgi:hypothetical protein
MSATLSEPAAQSPLEEFVRDYLEVAGGVWDEVEPQVYDVLLPPEASDGPQDAGGREILRVAFDPEALPEHPGSQLASFGTPLVDRLLQGAIRRGAYARAHWNGLNLSPHDLPGRVRRGLRLPDGARLEIERARPLDFVQAVYWFEAVFVSDQKEEEILSVAMDLRSGRQVRHLEKLLDESHLAEEPSLRLPEARRRSAAAAYPEARQQVIRSISSLANARRRELTVRTQRQIARMVQYYADLRSEIGEQARRARDRGEDAARFDQRREALHREEKLRVSELERKSAMRVQLKLIHVMEVRQPKLLVRTSAVPERKPAAPLELDLVWDPLVESLEPADCRNCGRPTLVLACDRRNRLVCPQCAGGGSR